MVAKYQKKLLNYLKLMETDFITEKQLKEILNFYRKRKMSKNKKDIQQETTNRWDKIGLLDGLEGHVAESVAKLYECQQSWIVNEGDTNEEFNKHEFDKHKFPIIKKAYKMNDHVVPTEQFFHLTKVEEMAKDLMEYVIEKYDINSLNDFTCEKHKALAKQLGFFQNPDDIDQDENIRI